ncbi:MAG: PKD domain-containing protein [Bacteroidetes bacterium]|nr:PKD domain-containing protein [Bacteroidota bacterium]MCA6443675.1 PKD domain-containing protein [Bacteroidota bacterium]
MKFLINKSYKFVFISLLWVLGCTKKQLPKNDTGNESPVFYMKGFINDIPISLEAGKNNVYMYPEWTYDVNDSIYSFVGTLKQKDCITNCGYSIKIKINANQTLAPDQSPNMSQALTNSNYSYQSPTPNSWYNCVFTSNSPYSAYNVWTFNDGSFVNGLFATKQFISGTTQTVNLSVNSGNCMFNTFNVYRIGAPLQINVWGSKDTAQTSKTFRFNSSNTLSSSSLTYHWDFGDGVSSALQNPVHTYPSYGYYLAKLKVKNGNSDSAVAYYRAAVVNGQPCNGNISTSMTQFSSVKPLSNIIVEVTDLEGKSYSSSTINQVAENFQIVSVENYDTTDKGVKTKKIKFTFNCKLASAGSILDIKNGEAVLALGYN